jgi:hypothetical protein
MKTSDGVGSLVLQATPEVDIVSIHQQVLNVGELVFTIAFDIEIAVWRSFFVQGNNYLGSVLVIGSRIIQIPAVHNSPAYPLLTASSNWHIFIALSLRSCVRGYSYCRCSGTCMV